MTIPGLRALLDDPETHRIVLDGYEGLYHLGITKTPDGDLGYYLRAPNAADGIRRAVPVREDLVTIVVDGDPARTLPAAAGQPPAPSLPARLGRIKRTVVRTLASTLVTHFTSIPEQATHRPLACGLAIQNWHDDERENRAIAGTPNVGTLGCFVTMADGARALLSAAHVLSEGNTGRNGHDAILQAPRDAGPTGYEAATLTNFVPLLWSPPTARPHIGSGVAYNIVDAAVARLRTGVTGPQSYLPARPPLLLRQVGTPNLEDQVQKVGSRTGATTGVVKAVATIASMEQAPYGVAWFKDTIMVEATGGMPFVLEGDSGALVVNPSTGDALGILYALDANGFIGLVCPLEPALRLLECTLVL